MNWMTKELMNWILQQQPPHRGFGFRVAESEDGIWLVCSLEEFAKYSQTQQEDLAAWLGFLCNSIRQKGVPCFIAREEDYQKEKSIDAV